ncbi:MAG: hypothetical protein JWQ28_3287 [Pedobacter sp.]|jgi:hypothetical protein|nr:hypothetical protein [Pedobacter sp.]
MNSEDNTNKTPEEGADNEQVKNDVQHPQGDESQQFTGGSTGPGDNYDQETKPNTHGSTQTGSYATDNPPDINIQSSDDLDLTED